MNKTEKVNWLKWIFRVPKWIFRFLWHGKLYWYIAIDFIPFFLLGICVVLIFTGGNTVLFNMMDHIISKHVPPEVYMRVLLLQFPTFLAMGLPMAVMFGVLMAFGRMSQHSELDVMRTSRVAAWRILFFMILIGAGISYGNYALIDQYVPRASDASLRLWRRYLVEQIAGRPASNIFFQGKRGTYFFISSFDPESGALKGVSVYQTHEQDSPYPRMMVAPDGTWQGEAVFLRNGRVYDVKKDGLLQFDSTFREMILNVTGEIEQMFGAADDPVKSGYIDPYNPGKLTQVQLENMKSLETDMIFNMSMNLDKKTLQSRIDLFKQNGVDTKALETNLHLKDSMPWSCLVCILLTVPLSIGGARAGSGTIKSMLLVLILMTLYYISTIVVVALGHSGVLPPLAAAWAQNAAFSAVGLLLALFYMRK